MLVGDPRQVTYLTHHESRYKKYTGGKLLDFLRAELPKRIQYEVDDTTLNASHRNSAAICVASSKLYPALQATIACECEKCRSPVLEGAGLFIVRKHNHAEYMQRFQPMQLRSNSATKGVDPLLQVLNFGESKGLGFDRVIIYPTDNMVRWMKNNARDLKDQTRAKFYVALTRARHSVAIVHDFKDNEIMDGFTVYE
jgi:DNA helicase-2/ATP-dependent DNA helicase PcrA